MSYGKRDMDYDGGLKMNLCKIPLDKVLPPAKPSLAELRRQAKQEYDARNVLADKEKPDFDAMLQKEMEELDV